MRLLIVIGQMQCGGAEYVVYNLFSTFELVGLQVRLVVLGKFDDKSFSNLRDKDIVFYQSAGRKSKLYTNLQKVKFIKSNIIEFDANFILGFIDSTNILTLLASIGLKIPVIISERNNPELSKMSKIWFYLRRMVYPFAGSLVIANDGLKKYCHSKKYNRRIDIIPNIIKPLSKRSSDKSFKKIIAVGSLSSQKRFDKLISAINHLYGHNKLSGFEVDIFGEGRLRSCLQNQINEAGLSNIIKLRGQSSQIEKKYIQSDIFVLCSDYEGQPNVLLEAMSCGLACISTDCDYGPREIIKHGYDGLLVPVDDIDQLSSGIYQLISNQELRNKLGKAARKKIKAEFSQEVVIHKWLDLFKELTQKNACHCSSL